MPTPPSAVPADRVGLPTGHHLRPVRAGDAESAYAAVMGSRERVWTRFGGRCSWPPPDLDLLRLRDQLARAVQDATAGRCYHYALFDRTETEVLGAVHVMPRREGGRDLEWTWWVVDWLVDSPVESALAAFLPTWLGHLSPSPADRTVPSDDPTIDIRGA